MIKKIILLLLCINIAVLAILFFQDDEPSLLYQTEGAGSVAIPHRNPTTIQLRNRPFTVFEYRSPKSPPVAIVLLASGDGGWNRWEDTVARDLQFHGYAVIGINSGDYAKTDYDLDTLQADYTTIIKTSLASYPNASPPIILCGWSMGAAQVIAVAGGPNRPPGLIGVVVVSLLKRGRYGLRIADQINVVPTGPGTFGVEDFASGLNGLSIAQWHGNLDNTDSTAWLAQLKTPHREFDYLSNHYFDDASPAFRQKFMESVNWILKSSK